MARASLARASLVWLQVLQQPYRMMAFAGVIIPALVEGRRGDMRMGVFEARVCV